MKRILVALMFALTLATVVGCSGGSPTSAPKAGGTTGAKP